MAASAEKVEKKEAKQSLLGLEGAFTDKLGTSEKCLCCSQRTTVTVICALLVLASLWHFGMNVYARWGKPCFIWWEHWASEPEPLEQEFRLQILPTSNIQSWVN